MRIFHIATAADWQRARRTGAYTTSTRGRTLAEEGFLHASRREQVAGVFRSFYADAGEPLVLLAIETDRLDVSWHEDPVGEDVFPHIYGALSPGAVVDVQPLNASGGTESFTAIFFREMLLRASLAVVVMVLAVLGSVLGGAAASDWGAFGGAVLGFGVGVLVVVVTRPRVAAAR